MKRRDFFAVLGGGIMVLLDDEIYAQETGGPRRGGGAVPVEIGAWLHIGETGEVTVYTGKVEVGQNARTSLTQAVVEELHYTARFSKDCDGRHGPHAVRPGHGGQHDDAAHVAADPAAAAAAREMLLDLAAQKWSVDRGSLAIAEGKVSAAGARRVRRTGARREVDAHDSVERTAGGGDGVEGGRKVAAQGQRARDGHGRAQVLVMT
jgi:isoquinoline 1-oxidoreductase